MKILNYDLENHTIQVSKQVAMKNPFVKSILDITMRDKNIYHIYELDQIFNNTKNLELLTSITETHPTLIKIVEKIVNNISNKETKRLSTPVSMELQTLSTQLYKQVQNFSNINSLLLLHFPYPKVDKLINKYFDEHSYNTLTYKEILEYLHPQCSTIYIRKLLFVGGYINADLLFPPKIRNNNQHNLHISDTTTLRETNCIPSFLNILMNICIWGFHFLFEQNHLKHILFFNPYNDILLYHYKKSAMGCSKVEFFISVPLEESINNNYSQNKYIEEALQEHYFSPLL